MVCGGGVLTLLLLFAFFSDSSGSNYLHCTSHSSQTIPISLHGPGDNYVINQHPTSRAMDQYNQGHRRCKWTFTPLHDSSVRIRGIWTSFPEDDHCIGSFLKIYTDNTTYNTALNFPGYKTQCGVKDFPSEIISKETVTVEFETTHPSEIKYYIDIVGTNSDECPPVSSNSRRCEDGPCCSGTDCCIVDLGTEPMGIASPGFPSSSGPGQNCKWKFVTTPGAQIMVNFKEMDMLKPLDSECSRQSVSLVDTNSAYYSPTAGKSLSFCGDLVPNYPGPSTFTSAANSIEVIYNTSSLSIKHGKGFKAAISALNPLCAPIKVSLSYQHHQCEHICGQTIHRPPTTPRPVCRWPHLKIHVQDRETKMPIADATLNLTNHRNADSSKVKLVTRHTGINGIVENLKFPEENVKVTATADGYESWTEEFNFTCKTGGCKSCEMIKIITLPMLPNDTYCQDVKGTVQIFDAITNQTLEKAIIDVFKIPLECEIPETEVVKATSAIEATTLSQTTLESRQNQQEETTTSMAATTLLSRQNIHKDTSLLSTQSSYNEAEPETEITTLQTTKQIEDHNDQTRTVENRAINPINCSEIKVVENEQTNKDGIAEFLIESNAHYIVRNIRHPKYITKTQAGTVNCTEDECDSCKLEMNVSMTRPSCDNATLHIHVRNNDTDDAIFNATVDIFTGGNKINTESLYSNSMGEVVYKVEDNGEYSVMVSAPGMLSVEESSVTKCNITACTKCATLVKFKLPPTVVTPVCDNSSLSSTILDIKTHQVISQGVRITLGYSPLDSTALTIIADNVTAIANFPIIENGNYSIRVTADGYRESTQHIIFNCSRDSCENCSQVVNIKMEEDFCEQTLLQMKVTDQNLPVKGADVFLYFSGTWNRLKIRGSTDESGLARLSVDGRAEYNVLIKKKGYKDKKTNTNIFCKAGLSCDECNPTLEVEIEEHFCNERVELVANVMDERLNPLENATVTVISKRTLNGPQNQVVEDPVKTNSSGTARQILQQFGVYTVNVTAEGFLAESRDVTVTNATACTNLTVPLNFTLPKKAEPFCSNASLVITIRDEHTGVILPTATVTVKLGEDLIASTVTGSDGKMSIEIEANGNYSIMVTKDGYLDLDESSLFQCSLDNCAKCNNYLTMRLDQPRCSNVIFPVTVTDYHENEKPVPDANVDLYQVETRSGVSNTFIERKQTNENGTATFRLEVNGNYTVAISAAGYISDDASLEHQCDHFHCQDCNPVLNPQIKKEFCENKTFEMIVQNAVTNMNIDGATVIVWMNINSLRDGKSTIQTDENGKAVFPILANGVYNVEISKYGFLTLTRTFTVDVQPGDCKAYQPVDLSPLSPSTLCKRGARVSLTWGEDPSDLDLYSYRVNNNDTAEECLTYYCDGKDPCNGTTHDVDNKNGGLNGSETITYCNTEDYVNMIYVDDLSGRGKSLLGSSAKLLIQANNQSVEVPLNPKATDEKKRYWLAGCLLLQDSGFIFLEVNEMRDGQPSIENPHFCYNLVQLKRQKEADNALQNAKLTVNVEKENTIFFGSSVEVKTPSGLSRLQETSKTGKAVFSIFENGWYEVTVRAPGYSPAVEKVFIKCNHTDILCSSEVNLALSILRPEGNIKIKLNWEEALNLDLHSVQIDKESTATHCETFYGQRSACRGSVFGQDIRTGGMPPRDEGEAIIIEKASNNPTLTYMVFVHDNSERPDLRTANTRISVMAGNKEEIVQMPAATIAEATFWFAGCVAVNGESFYFVAVNTFSRASPLESDRLHCVELFRRSQPTPPPAFCAGKTLDINIRDSENNSIIDAAKIDVVRVRDQKIETINVTSAMTEYPKLSIESNGLYKVNVYKAGFQRTSNEVNIACNINKCRQCQPSVTIPMVGTLREKQPRVVLVWEKQRANLDLYAIQNNIATGTSKCSSRETACRGITYNVHSNARTRNNFQSLTIGQPITRDISVNNSVNYFTVVVDLKSDGKGNEVINEFIKNSKVHLIITDSHGESVRVNMKTQTYKKDRYWIAGCIGGEYLVSGSFTEINEFLDTPPEEGEDYCKHFITKGLKNCFAGLRGPSYSVADNGGLIEKTKFDSVKECADKCTLLSDCQAFDWFGPGDSEFKTCLLYKSGKLSGSLDDRRIRYAAICPK